MDSSRTNSFETEGIVSDDEWTILDSESALHINVHLSISSAEVDTSLKDSTPEYGTDNMASKKRTSDEMVAKIVAISKELILDGIFNGIGEKQNCYRAIIEYLEELKDGGPELTAQRSLDTLFVLTESGTIDEQTNELRDILTDLQKSRPELFEIDLNEKILEIANELVFQGSFKDLGKNVQCMLAISSYLTPSTNAIDIFGHTETCSKILSLHETGQTADLEKQIRVIIMSMQSAECKSSRSSKKYSEIEYLELVELVIKIVNDCITIGAYDDIFESKADCIMSALAYLSIQEQDLKQQFVLPKEHEDILKFHKEDNIDGLVRYLRQLFIKGRETYAVDRIELRVEKATKELAKHLNPDDESNTKTSRRIEGVVAILGTTFTVGLSTLRTLAPMAQSFKSLIDTLNIALLNPAFSSWPVLGAVSVGFAGGILVWNAYCVMRRKKSLRLAMKDSLSAVGPMVISSAVGGLAAFALASIAPPIWTSLLAFAGVAFVAHLIAQPLVERFSRWVFFELPEKQAKCKAYATLEVNPNVTDEELRRAYRNQSRKYHPDKTEENLTSKLLEVQQAYEFLVSIRLKEMGSLNEPGFLERLRKFFANVFQKEDENNNAIPSIKTSYSVSNRSKNINYLCH